MKQRQLVVDANILLRGVLGVQVVQLMKQYGERVAFYAPDVCFDDASRHLPAIASSRGLDASLVLYGLERLKAIVGVVDADLYQDYQATAAKRIGSRDADDWPVVACCLLLDCPVWTEDSDFFGSGLATWTTKTVGLYLEDDPDSEDGLS